MLLTDLKHSNSFLFCTILKSNLRSLYNPPDCEWSGPHPALQPQLRLTLPKTPASTPSWNATISLLRAFVLGPLPESFFLFVPGLSGSAHQLWPSMAPPSQLEHPIILFYSTPFIFLQLFLTHIFFVFSVVLPDQTDSFWNECLIHFLNQFGCFEWKQQKLIWLI